MIFIWLGSHKINIGTVRLKFLPTFLQSVNKFLESIVTVLCLNHRNLSMWLPWNSYPNSSRWMACLQYQEHSGIPGIVKLILKILLFIFIYNPIHKLIKLQFKVCNVSCSHCLYLGLVSQNPVNVDVNSQLLLLKMGVFSKTPRMFWETSLSCMLHIKPEAGFMARRKNMVKMQWMNAYISTLYLQVELKEKCSVNCHAQTAST